MKVLVTENQFKKIINLISEAEKQKNVLFVGDSLSTGDYTWNKILAKIHPEWKVDYLTKGGVQTKWMLNELSDKLNDKKYDLVFIYGGTNDMFGSIDKKPQDIYKDKMINKALSNIQSMVNLINQSGAKAIVFSGYDADEVMTKSTKFCDDLCMRKGRERMVEFQQALKNISNAEIIPIVQADSSWTNDGIHPGGSGHQIMANFVDNFLKGKISSVGGTDKKIMSGLSWLENLKNKMVGSDTESSSLFDNLIDNLSDFKDSGKVLNYVGTILDDDIVYFYQTALQLLGFSLPIHGIDGKFGPETKRAIKKFQSENDIEPLGAMDNKTTEVLINKLDTEGITNQDFEKLQITKTSTPEILSDTSMIPQGEAKITSSTINKFKKLLEEKKLSYSDFENKVKSIGLSPEIAIQQLFAESSFSPNVVNCSRQSSAGAKGIAQFIDSSWSSYGKGSPCNVGDALDAYVKLMAELMNKFPKRIDLALAGYNSGPNKAVYKTALQKNIPFNELKGQIPNETFNYVNKIIKV